MIFCHLSYSPNPYLAFPLGFGDMKRQSAFAECLEKDQQTKRNIRIEAVRYHDHLKIEAEKGYDLDQLFTGLSKSLGRKPHLHAYWLYKVTSFTSKVSDSESFLIMPTKDTTITLHWFDDLNDVLSFCFLQYGVAPELFFHFKNSANTHFSSKKGGN